MYTNQTCGSWLACEGGLTAGLSFADVHQSIVGASLLAMAAGQPTNLSQVYISIPAVTAAGGFALTATHFFYK
ncbi:hypothetical protein ACQKP6_29345, partial [Pseudomonas fluorescens]|uniref:hypothetical protein n=1 Tax=Pseudomonas fluorescens TaxID=294 RepID=UPI003CFCA4DC